VTSNAGGADILSQTGVGSTSTPIPSQLLASRAGSRSIGCAET
jgi:hypothetical protein